MEMLLCDIGFELIKGERVFEELRVSLAGL